MAETLENLDDESLMNRIQKNDHRAFSVLVERRSSMFYAAAYRIVMNQQDAEDVVQDSFLKIWDKPMLWKIDKGAKFTTWFYRIIVNLSIDKKRKNSKEMMIETSEEIQSFDMSQDQVMEKDEEQKVLDGALVNLPEKQLIALNLCFYEGVSNKEAAEIMKINVKALESLLMRAKANVRDQLIRQGILAKENVA